MLTIYNTVILVRSIIKFLDRNFIFIEKVRFNFNLKRREPSRYRDISKNCMVISRLNKL